MPADANRQTQHTTQTQLLGVSAPFILIMAPVSKLLLLALLVTLSHVLAATATATAGVWSNWDGHQTCIPAASFNVTTEADAQKALLIAAGRPIRVAGAGHSFTGIDLTNGVMLGVIPPSNISQVSQTPDFHWVLCLRCVPPALCVSASHPRLQTRGSKCVCTMLHGWWWPLSSVAGMSPH